MKYSLKKLLVATAVIAFAVWFVHSAYVGFTHVETAENASTVDWLPNSATSISYYRSYSFTAYEFEISETDFRSWARWDVAEIVEPVTITRYTFATTKIPDPGDDPTDDEIEAFLAAKAQRYAGIDDGLYYASEQTNGGGIWVGYDRKLGRGFYQSAPR